MYKLLMLSLFFGLLACNSKEQKQDEKTNTTNNAPSFAELPTYDGSDLGLTYTPAQSSFRIWSPSAEAVTLKIYEKGDGGEAIKEESLKKAENGTWIAQINEDLKGKYYTFQVKIDGKSLPETPGIYAKAVGLDGKRAMIIDLKSTDPEGWANDKKPALKNATDIILYELHIRDFSIHKNSGAKNKGKFLAFTEKNTKNATGQATGIDHLKELGITHVHLLPSFDFYSIDESKPNEKYNWGYDPQNYNVPEGSYSSNPNQGEVRIKEFKQMVKALHDQGLRVIMDVVYNHTGITEGSNFNSEFPQYYYRQNKEGKYSDASACGNETASDRAMMRKYMVESVKYWATEYHVDGFRFDLMGIHDVETMNQITEELDKIDPTLFVYGEGWLASGTPLPEEQQAIKKNVLKLKKVAAFSDEMRDAIKGHWSEEKGQGFVSGKTGLDESVKFGIVAATQHPQIDYTKVNYSKSFWANQPSQTINYVSCHDNHTLFDKLKVSNPEASEADILKMDILANTMVLTSQGVSFIHAGEEMARTKYGEHNSYVSPDSINQLDWTRKNQYKDLFAYYKNLIALRKNHPAFRLPTTDLIQKHLKFMENKLPNVVGFTLEGNAGGDSWKNILVIYNGNLKSQKVNIPAGNWTVVLNEKGIKEAGLGTNKGGEFEMAGISALVLVQK